MKACGISDGSFVQVTSKLRGGGKRKGKRSNAEEKQAVSQKRLESLQGQLEQKDAQESESDNIPAVQKCDKDKVFKQFEEHEEYQKIIVFVSEGNDTEVEQKMLCYLTGFQEWLGLDSGQVDIVECGIRRAVEARRRKQAAEQEQGKKVHLSEQEDQPEEMPAQSTDKPDVKMRLGEQAGRRAAREGRGYAGLVQVRDERA